MSEKNRTIEDDIQDALNEIKNTDEVVDESEIEAPEEVDETPEVEPELDTEKKPTVEVEESEEVEALEVKEPEVEGEIDHAPQSWSGLQKEKWSDIPKEARDYIKQREAEAHQKITAHDGDRVFGKTIKEQFTPYMPMIEAEGGTPEGAIKDYLQMSYVLRQGTPDQKANMIRSAMQQFSIDPNQVLSQQPNQRQPNDHIMQKLQALEIQLAQKDQLSEQAESDTIQAEITAFESDPANIYYNDVKLQMAALLQNDVAVSLEDAYEQAIWAHPQVRSSLIAKQNAKAKEERKTQVEAKKRAASSVTGSPDKSASPKAQTGKYVDPTASVEAAFKELEAGNRV